MRRKLSEPELREAFQRVRATFAVEEMELTPEMEELAIKKVLGEISDEEFKVAAIEMVRKNAR